MHIASLWTAFGAWNFSSNLWIFSTGSPRKLIKNKIWKEIFWYIEMLIMDCKSYAFHFLSSTARTQAIMTWTLVIRIQVHSDSRVAIFSLRLSMNTTSILSVSSISCLKVIFIQICSLFRKSQNRLSINYLSLSITSTIACIICFMLSSVGCSLACLIKGDRILFQLSIKEFFY